MKKLHFQVFCQAYYRSSLEVPDDMSLEEALGYAAEHLSDAPIEGGLEYIPESDEILAEDFDNPDIVYFTGEGT